jgi:hypothetical protein
MRRQLPHLTQPPATLTRREAESSMSFIQFDNTHFRRDNPNVPSDLEQMPHLLNFMKDNGTVLANDHTQLISGMPLPRK